MHSFDKTAKRSEPNEAKIISEINTTLLKARNLLKDPANFPEVEKLIKICTDNGMNLISVAEQERIYVEIFSIVHEIQKENKNIHLFFLKNLIFSFDNLFNENTKQENFEHVVKKLKSQFSDWSMVHLLEGLWWLRECRKLQNFQRSENSREFSKIPLTQAFHFFQRIPRSQQASALLVLPRILSGMVAGSSRIDIDLSDQFRNDFKALLDEVEKRIEEKKTEFNDRALRSVYWDLARLCNEFADYVQEGLPKATDKKEIIEFYRDQSIHYLVKGKENGSVSCVLELIKIHDKAHNFESAFINIQKALEMIEKEKTENHHYDLAFVMDLLRDYADKKEIGEKATALYKKYEQLYAFQELIFRDKLHIKIPSEEVLRNNQNYFFEQIDLLPKTPQNLDRIGIVLGAYKSIDSDASLKHAEILCAAGELSLAIDKLFEVQSESRESFEKVFNLILTAIDNLNNDPMLHYQSQVFLASELYIKLAKQLERYGNFLPPEYKSRITSLYKEALVIDASNIEAATAVAKDLANNDLIKSIEILLHAGKTFVTIFKLNNSIGIPKEAFEKRKFALNVGTLRKDTLFHTIRNWLGIANRDKNIDSEKIKELEAQYNELEKDAAVQFYLDNPANPAGWKSLSSTDAIRYYEHVIQYYQSKKIDEQEKNLSIFKLRQDANEKAKDLSLEGALKYVKKLDLSHAVDIVDILWTVIEEVQDKDSIKAKKKETLEEIKALLQKLSNVEITDQDTLEDIFSIYSELNIIDDISLSKFIKKNIDAHYLVEIESLALFKFENKQILDRNIKLVEAADIYNQVYFAPDAKYSIEPNDIKAANEKFQTLIDPKKGNYNPFASYYYALFLESNDQNQSKEIIKHLELAFCYGVDAAFPSLYKYYNHRELELVPILFTALRSHSNNKAMIAQAEALLAIDMQSNSTKSKSSYERFYIALVQDDVKTLKEIFKKSPEIFNEGEKVIKDLAVKSNFISSLLLPRLSNIAEQKIETKTQPEKTSFFGKLSTSLFKSRPAETVMGKKKEEQSQKGITEEAKEIENKPSVQPINVSPIQGTVFQGEENEITIKSGGRLFVPVTTKPVTEKEKEKDESKSSLVYRDQTLHQL